MAIKIYTIMLADGKGYEIASDVNLAALFEKKDDGILDAVIREDKAIVGVIHFNGVTGVFEEGFQQTYKAEIKRAFAREQEKLKFLPGGVN